MPLPHFKPFRLRANRLRDTKPHRTGARLKKIFRALFIASIVGILFLFFAGTLVLAWARASLPNPDRLSERHIEESTKIYDRTGAHLLYEIFEERKRTVVELDQIADSAKWATIAIEDKNFYKHRGVAFRSILRAAVSNMLGRTEGRGGASTLTQQLVKNAIVGTERTFARKIKDVILAIELERSYTKDQILKLYFNEIPYGSTNYGIEAAAQSYFGKSAKDLTLGEAATIAALPQAPTKYLNHPDKLAARRNYILDLMVEQGYTDRGAADAAKKEALALERRVGAIVAPHFVLMVKEELSKTFGERVVEQGGLRVTTALDLEKQKIAEEEVKKGAERNEKKYKAGNAALVALEAKTGHLLALVGSRDFFDEKYDGQVNVALRLRQPGSSFKPVVYAAAFAKGYTPQTILYDVVTKFATEVGDYEPHDYDDKERGPVTITQALAGSLNIPAVKTIYLAGIDRVLDLADTLGYTTLKDRSRFGLALVLGGGEVKLLEHVGAFATFAREGVQKPIVSILKVEDSRGNVLYEWKDASGERVLDEGVVRSLTDIMSDDSARAYIFGAGSALTLPDRPVAAKTGTTNDWRDGWTLGFTPSLAAGVWAGNNNNKPMARGADGVLVAAPIWNAFMKRALKGAPLEVFKDPPKNDASHPILKGQLPGEFTVNVDRISGKLATADTPPETIEERTYREVHSILYYINKDDPRGPAPEHPETNPHYERWEEAVARWAAENNFVSGAPPTEYDDVHKGELKPTVAFTTIAEGALIARDQHLEVNATAPRKVARVRYFLDGIFVKEITGEPFGALVHFGPFEPGTHLLTAAAYDDVWNKGETTLAVELTGEPDPPQLTFTLPLPDSTVTKKYFPLTIGLSIDFPARTARVQLTARKEDGTSLFTIGDLQPPFQGTHTVQWVTTPVAGAYLIEATLTDTAGRHTAASPLRVVVTK